LRGLRARNVVAVVGVLLGVGIMAMPGAGAAADEGKRVRILDDCDPATFNENLGPGACVGDGKTTFEKLFAELTATGAAKRWAFKPDDFHVDSDEPLHAVSRGGEFHTFSEVADFGGGCVPEINQVLGLNPVQECDNVVQTPDGPVPVAFIETGVAPGGDLHVDAMSPGLHKFQCLIHPWMRSMVEVRATSGGHGGHH
jgi:hypothetical protein